jgi:AcrR family transcriptional regulator
MSLRRPAENLWDRTRALVHAQVVDVALEMFLTEGFDATTIEQIVTAAGISRRSFFRYFGTKEDIVLGDADGQGRLLAVALAARPPEEDPWIALERAAASLPSSKFTPERAFAVAKLVVTTPSLRARHAQKRAEWQQALVPVIQRRMGNVDQTPDIRATAIVASALACLDAATDVWVSSGGQEDFARLYAEAISTIRGQPGSRSRG